MNIQQRELPLIYKNDFISVVIEPGPDGSSCLCCFSINIARFDRLSKGTYGIGSNPAFKGLQLLRADASAFALEKGARPRSTPEGACARNIPRGHGWYHESLIIEQTSEAIRAELLRFSVSTLVKRVLTVCRPDAPLPQEYPDPAALQDFLISLEKT